MRPSYVFFADGFEEIEALTVVDVMRRAGMPVVTMSIYETPEAIGAHGVTVVADESFDPDLLEDAEWLICPGGMPGASNLAENETLCEIIKEQNEKGEKIAAICASPSIILGPLGLIDGRCAVCYPGMEDGMAGAEVLDQMVVVDGNIITGKGPAAAAEFALAIVANTVGEAVANDVAAGMLL
jgi:4-methyl-5(b-hydroxyethyl)-thiazole monophosphate biosynthesis